ncbi:Mtla2 master regulator (activator) of a-type mating [Candida orthopsilosis Co 90-125]|uniref:Mtla2 master regulator (Activator) of a-type mating n=2 Tax=Candida orthopsilosis TaxID=273371 RepID=H8X859_CANO9|nr:Mtla2 master regulator (activator) of a-type mating [Candida orthopsilosis Co 90-125]ADY62690.1 MTLa2 [Candida orthopsilosis]CCG24158.1 Mtla2 master regulator (activator) of a-type mating [Candida orthopsilosis Co 90-125]
MFSYKFCFPKVSKEFPKRIKDFTDDNSFPILSINVALNKTTPDFVHFSTASTEKGNKFRSRNSFIIARSTLSSMLKKNIYELQTVSKGVSQLWSHVDSSFKTYFEYLSVTESIWYDRKIFHNSTQQNNKNYIPKNSGLFASRQNFKKKDENMPKKHRFRLKKSIGRIKRPKVRRFTNGFKISSTSMSCNYGILTEDVFK